MVTVSQFLEIAFNGFILGMIFVLIAIGLSLIFGVMGVVNFAHGDLLLVGAYTAWAVDQAVGSFIMSVLVATLIVGLVGVVIERTLLRYLYDKPLTLQFLLTLGIAEILREGVQIIWGRQNKIFEFPNWGKGMIDLGLFSYPVFRIVVITVTAVCVLSLYLFLTRTDTGTIIRAAFYDREMMNALGINVKRTYQVVFALGAGLAGLAGAMVGPVQNLSPTLGVNLLIPSFVVVIIGGVGSLRGSIIGGLLVGQILVFAGSYFPSLSRVLVFLAMAAVLIVQPRGLFGKAGMFD